LFVIVSDISQTQVLPNFRKNP